MEIVEGETLADAPVARGGSWGINGTVVFAPLTGGGPLYRISETGDEPTPVTCIAAGHGSHLPVSDSCRPDPHPQATSDNTAGLVDQP